MTFQRNARAFTLIELLVVIAIIAVLASLALSVMSKVQGHMRATICESNQRQLMAGFLAFAADHDGILPGGYCDSINNDPVPFHHDWLGSVGNPTAAPQNGTLFPYVGRNYSIYLCPGTSDQINLLNTGLITDYVSNGRFDYTCFGAWDGAPIRDVKLQSRYWKSDGTYDYLPTPIICEEGSEHINGYNAEGDHSSSDFLTHHHFGGGYYGCIDGSVAFYVEPVGGGSGQLGGFNWQSIGPRSHQWACIGLYDPNTGDGPNFTGWGYWSHQ